MKTEPDEVAGEIAADQDEPKGSAEKDKTKQAEETDIAKTRQQLDQERANARKAREARETAEAERDEMAQRLTETNTRLSELEARLKDQLTAKEYAGLENLDPETTDVPELVKAFQRAAARVQALEQRAQKAETFIENVAKRDQEQRRTSEQRMLEEKVYSRCDAKFGAQYRNDAIALADELVTSGDVEKPADIFGGIELMERCYEETAAKKAKPKEKKKEVVTDTGLRGLSVTDIEDSEEFKPGTTDAVKADMLKKMRAGKWRKDAFAGSG